MEDIDLSKATEKLQQLRDQPVKSVTELPFELQSRRSNKTTKLVANSGNDTSMNGANRWFEFNFTEPVFLCDVVVTMDNYGTYDTFEFKWDLAQGGQASQDIDRESDTTYRATINQLVTGVSFKPPKKWLTSTQIRSIKLVGFQIDELEEFVQLIARLDRFKGDIETVSVRAIDNATEANESLEELRQERDQLAIDVTASTKKVTNLNNQIGRLTEQRNGLIADVNKREETITKLDEQEETIKERIAERNSERTGLAGLITEQKQKLRSLQNDINMFPTEISGFVDQAVQSTKTYWRLSWIPIFILVVITSLLVFNAANLTTVVDEQDNARIFSILITRMPYVIISTAIIGAAYKLAALFVAEIMRINQQRLNLSKISIIATDVSKASEDGLEGLSDDEIYELRTRLKMDMLRDHMKDYLSKSFLPSKKKVENANHQQQDDSVEDESLLKEEETTVEP